MRLTELPVLPTNAVLFIQLFKNYTLLLDLQGANQVQEFPMSVSSFEELKVFIKQLDDWNENNPLKKWEYLGTFIKDNEPMYPALESEHPYMLIDGYRFNIKINQ